MEVKYIEFGEPTPSASGKTQIWEVLAYESSLAFGFSDEDALGEIRWFPHWRRYAFYPGSFTAFEQDCLRKIADFCEEQTAKLRQQWKKRRVQTGQTQNAD